MKQAPLGFGKSPMMKQAPIGFGKPPLIEHSLGHFQPYSQWSAPNMPVYGEFVPVRSSMGCAGYDLFAAEDCVITHDNKSGVVSTGLVVQIPVGHYGKVEGRSSLALQHNVVAFGGVIDEDYRGIVQVKLFNHCAVDYLVKKGDCIAQLILHRYCVANVQQVLSESPYGFGVSGR